MFLDRDGVLTRSRVVDGKAYAPRRLADFRLLPYAAASVRRMHELGYVVVVVTNQPDIGNGLVDAREVDVMHRKLADATQVDDIFMCPHRQDEGCACRKPRPGMLLAAAKKHGISLRDSYMVGDRRSDVEAGQRAGCRTIFIDRAYAEARPTGNDATVTSLKAATDFISTHSKRTR